MFHYFVVCLYLLGVVSAQIGGYNYARANVPVSQVHLTQHHTAPATATASVVSAPVPAALHQHIIQQAAPLKYEIRKEFYFFKAPEELNVQHPITLHSQTVPNMKIHKYLVKKAFSQNLPKPTASQQQVNNHHSAMPEVHYVTYKTAAGAHQFGGGHKVNLGGQMSASNVNRQHFISTTSNINKQYLAPAVSNVNIRLHSNKPETHFISNTIPGVLNVKRKYFKPAASNVNSQYIPPAVSSAKIQQLTPTPTNLNIHYSAPVASNVEGQYHVPAVSNGNSQYVVDLPADTNLQNQNLQTPGSNVNSEHFPPER